MTYIDMKAWNLVVFGLEMTSFGNQMEHINIFYYLRSKCLSFCSVCELTDLVAVLFEQGHLLPQRPRLFSVNTMVAFAVTPLKICSCRINLKQ